MKRTILNVVLAGVLGLGAVTLSNAQQAGRAGGDSGPRGRGPGRGGFALLRDANLTDEQKAQIKAIRDAEQPQAGPPADAGLRRQLEAELFADAPDGAKIAALQQQLVQAQAERLAREITSQQKVAAVLTAEQRAQIRERLSQAPERGAGRRGY